MAIVNRVVSTSQESATAALKALAGVVGISDSITFNSDVVASGVEMKVTAKNSFTNTDSTSTVAGFTACAKAICKAVPECSFWGPDEAAVEKWVESASAVIASDDKGKSSRILKNAKTFPRIQFT